MPEPESGVSKPHIGSGSNASSLTDSRSATTATITVRGTPLSVVPGWAPPVTQSATVTVERITR